MFSPQMKKGSVELLVLSILEEAPLHGYEIGRQIEIRSAGHLQFRISSLYSVLRRLEKRGAVKGRWVEKAGVRRRRFYRLTTAGQSELSAQRGSWNEFMLAVNAVVGWQHA